MNYRNKLISVLLVFLLLVTFNIVSGQKTEISGKVIDTLQHPVQGMVVSLINSRSHNVIQYKRTTVKGEFQFVIDDTVSIPNAAIQVKSALFKPVFLPLLKDQRYYTIRLYELRKELDPVEVTASRPMVVKKGDTIRYNFSSFATSNDKVISDVLPKIPGIEVGSNGIIKYNGMPISNFFIEGDNILDKRYNIAANNISKDVVDEIQILENNQPIKILRGVSIPYNAALNITFKKGFRGKVINNVNVGVGIPALAEADYNQIILKQFAKGINYFKYNNTGTDFLNDHVKQDLNDMSKEMEVNWTEQLLAVNTVLPPPIQKFRYNFNSNLAGSANLLFKLKNDFIIRSNSFYLTDKTKNDYKSYTRILLPDMNVSFLEDQHLVQSPRVYYQQLILNKNSNSFYFNDELSIELNEGFSRAAMAGTSLTGQQLNIRNRNLLNDLRVIKKMGGLLVDFNSYTSINTNPQSLMISKGVLENILNDSMDYKQTRQFVDNKICFSKNQLSAGINRENIKIKAVAGVAYSRRHINTDLLLLTHDDLLNKPVSEDPYINNSTSEYFKKFALLNFTFENIKNKIDVNISPSHYNLSIKKIKTPIEYRSFFAINTSVSYKRQLGRENSLRLMYNYENEPGEIGNLFSGRYLNNYRTIFYNDLPYLSEKNHGITLNYNFQKSLKLLFITLTSSSKISHLDYILENNISALSNTLSYKPFANQQKMFNTSLNATKYSFKLKTSLGIKFNHLYRDFNIMQNGKPINYISTSNQVTLSFRPSINKHIRLNTEFYATRFNSRPENYSGPVPVIYKMGTNTAIDVFVTSDLSLRINGESVSYKNTLTNTNTNYFVDAFVKYVTKKKKVFYELKAINILNRKSYLLQQTDINFVQSSEYLIRPFSLLLTANIKL